MENFDDSIKREFLSEAQEMLEEVEGKFLDLERNPSDRSIMDHIFRLAHTVKGSSFAAGFEELGAFAHTFETLLNLLREGKMEADQNIVDLLLRSNDTLRRFVEALNESYDATLDVVEITQELLDSIGTEGHKKWDGPAFGFFDDDPAQPAQPAQPVTATKDSSATQNSTTVQSTKANSVGNIPAPPKGVHLGSAMMPTVLVCDDEPDIIELATEMLKVKYPVLNIVSAKDGLEALEKVKEFKPHAIVTDLRMPNLNGIQFVHEVRKHDQNVPVIFFSGYADRANVIEFIKLGVMDFHDKPIDSDRLGLSVANALKLSQTREGITRLSTLNFKAYMSILKMSQLEPSQKKEAEEISNKVKVILDEVAVLSNFILGL
jgi:chemotaxis protein histidine kinase CheA